MHDSEIGSSILCVRTYEWSVNSHPVLNTDVTQP